MRNLYKRYKNVVKNKRRTQVADTTITLNLDEVEVHARGAYAVLNDVDVPYESDDSDIAALNGSEVEHLGDGKVALTLPCGDAVAFDVSKVVSVLFKVCDA